ncbi:MAG: hypothetical protein H6718_04775 [Polyangiaceae bacterium]|nr:hypothetical protein [Polyangiaceae bacterium]MCB9609122.1 hypothetical protein [Polyangiaceae bacterium]
MSLVSFKERASEMFGTLESYWKAATGRVSDQPSIRFIGVCCILLAAVTLLRPLFFAAIPESVFQGPVIVWTLIERDCASIVLGAKRNSPQVPSLLFLVLPTLVVLWSKRDVSWGRWECGKAFRNLILVMVFIMAWAGATFDYNMYLDRGHFVDRALLVLLAIWTWRTPLALPWFTLLSVVLMRECFVPLGHDDFDYRPMFEMLIIMSISVWFSVFRWVRTKHVVFLSLCSLGSYYFAAGVAKWEYGPEHSWLLENQLSNLAMTNHSLGWLGFISEGTFIKIVQAASHMNVINAGYTLFVVELGVIVLMFLPPRISRYYWLAAALLHVGIFAFSGIFFWKWIVTDVAIFFFLRGGGLEIHKQIWAHKLGLLFGVALLWFSLDRVYFWPQIGVAWYDSRVLEHYTLVGVDRDGEKHVIDPLTITPFDTRFIQGDFGYVTREKTLSRTMGTTADYRMMTRLNNITSDAELVEIEQKYGRSKYRAKSKQKFDQLIARYFSNTNRYGGRRHRWLAHIGRPDHIWMQAPGEFYDFKKPLKTVEVHRQRVFYDGQKIVRRPDQLLYEIAIP